MIVPIPMPLPKHVSISWTPTNAACVVWCGECETGTMIYVTALKTDHDALVKAVNEHTDCRGVKA